MPDFVRIFDILGTIAERNDAITRQQEFALQALTSGFGQGAFSITVPANVNTPDPKQIVAKAFQENTNDLYGYSDTELVAIAVAKSDAAKAETKVVHVDFARTRDDVVTDDPVKSGRHVFLPLSDSNESNVISFARYREQLMPTG